MSHGCTRAMKNFDIRDPPPHRFRDEPLYERVIILYFNTHYVHTIVARLPCEATLTHIHFRILVHTHFRLIPYSLSSPLCSLLLRLFSLPVAFAFHRALLVNRFLKSSVL